MRLIRHYEDVPADARGGVAAIGNFDGLHLGHQTVIAAATDLAGATGVAAAIITFEPHPYAVFHAGTAPFRLTPFRIKMPLLDGLGLDIAFVLPFDAALHRKAAADFVADVLVAGLGISHLVIGEDFVFGRDRGGNSALLATLARHHGFGLSSVPKVSDGDGHPYSSTKVRQYLGAGQPHLAAAQLGRAWEVEGRVESGERRGRTIGFPTANIALGDFLVPAHGVYAVRAGVVIGEAIEWHDGVANVGRRPTVGGAGILLEVHLFDFDGDLYGSYLRVALIDHLRAEKKFDGIDALRAQIVRDAEQARAVLATDRTALEIGMRQPPTTTPIRIV
ncbi:MAG: bifunctional riboflavin kinase/FAD synthetase [Alphaproteobacteria bacterium]|nr:MAG: bifunctional riboflavin kinase/FAD synthetase [Alphaproteobacteria bacterium]